VARIHVFYAPPRFPVRRGLRNTGV
jgi:hypothetical protein